jgi:hypothetical protein
MFMQAPAFTGEYAPLGPLYTLVQCALVLRLCLASVMSRLGLRNLAPYPSYLSALQAGVKFDAAWKKVKSEVALASAAFLALAFWLGQLLWKAYEYRRYGYL